MKKVKRVSPRHTTLLLVMAGVGLFGLGSILASHAATLATSAEAESGTLSGNASAVSDTSASGGQAVKFASTIPPTHSSGQWLMISNYLTTFLSDDPTTAKWFFDSSNSFTLGISAVSGLAATQVKNYKSYQLFSQDIANNAIPSNIHWVMYDNENWTDTPTSEQQDPATYMQDFAQLAHAHNLKVIETPARDLMVVGSGKCTQQTGESVDQAFIRCGIPADAQYADIYEIQAQTDQPTASSYRSLVAAARAQVLSLAPNITIMAGLTTDRSDTAAQVFAAWQATHTLVAGYWMNTQSDSLSIAEQAMDMIEANGG